MQTHQDWKKCASSKSSLILQGISEVDVNVASVNTVQVRKGRREIELGRESIEDDRRRLASKEARLAESAADSQEKHHSITL